MSKTIFFSVGEPSGDQHTARLIRSLLESDPELELRGFGGPEMRAAGCALDLDLTEHAVFGLLEVLPKLRQFFRFADQAEALFAEGKVDAVVLVDFPGFNWHIAKRAKKYGIPVYYYCPPQLWAWGAWRVKKMKASVDHVLAVLPIEKEFFEGHGIPTTYVGHPFFDAVAETRLDPRVSAQLHDSATGAMTVAVLPGSRTHEVHRNFPVMLEAISDLTRSHPDVRFAVAAYRDTHLEFCQNEVDQLGGSLPIDFYLGATSEIVEHAKCAMMVSGSVSLELMARGTPAAVLYRVGRFLYEVGKRVIKVDSVTLPNLMPDPDTGRRSPEAVFPELVSVGKSGKASEFLAESVDRMLREQDYYQAKREQLARFAEAYARPGATTRAADLLYRLVANRGEGDSMRVTGRSAA